MYAAVLWEALQQRPVARLLEDLGDGVDKSLRSLMTIAARVQPTEPEGSRAEQAQVPPRGCDMMLCTSRTPRILGNHTCTSSRASQPAVNQRHRVICLTLEPLDSSAILEIALSALRCDSPAEPMAKLIVGEQYPKKDASRICKGHARHRDVAAAAHDLNLPMSWDSVVCPTEWSNGIPRDTVELCEWLTTAGLVCGHRWASD